MSTPNRITNLIIKYLENSLSEDEERELNSWVNASEDNKRVFDVFTSEYIFKSLNEIPSHNIGEFKKKKNTHHSSKWKSFSLATAAIVLFIITAIAIYHKTNSSYHKSPIVSGLKAGPDENSVILTLADGLSIKIDTASSLIKQQNAVIKNNGNEIEYISLLKEEIPGEFNSLSTPFGKQIKILLSDGSKVWLNAFSTIHFPTSFNNKVRKVEIKGEAYFEIAQQIDSSFPGSKVPFVVDAAGVQINVLGTHFNIKAYDNETVKTSLLEGSVEIKKGNTSCLIEPGQQVKLNPKGIFDITQINKDEIIAWKKDLFVFNNEEIEPVMQEISRWYNVNIVFEDTIIDKLTTTVSRKIPLQELLKLLQLMCNAHFRIENRTVFISK